MIKRLPIRRTMKSFFKFFWTPYGLLKDKSFRWWIVVGCSLFCSLFLWVFEPYGLYLIDDLYEKIFVVGLYAIGSFMVLSLYYILQSFCLKVYTIGSTVLWIALSFLLVGIVSAFIHESLFNEGHLRWQLFAYFQWIIFTISIIPILISVLVYHNITLRKRLKDSATMDGKKMNLDGVSMENDNSKSIVVVNSENRNERFDLPVGDLLYITSSDNYIDVYFVKDGFINHRLIRYSLSGVASDNREMKEIFRCHKSYIVNRKKIESVFGNTAGYRIKLLECDFLVPVSRKLNKEVSEFISL